MPWRLPWSAVAIAAEVAMVPPIAFHGTPTGAMESYPTPWDVVGILRYAMDGWYHGHATKEPNRVELSARINDAVLVVLVHRPTRVICIFDP